MGYKRLISAGLLLAATVTMAVQAVQMQSASNDRNPAGEARAVQPDQPKQVEQPAVNPLIATPEDGLEPRQPLSKRPEVVKPSNPRNRLIVKFGDAVRMRTKANGEVRSEAGFATGSVNDLCANLGVHFEPAVPQSEDVVEDIRRRAAQYSRRMQPDFKGMHYVYGPPANLQAVADALHQMNIVEFVQWDRYYQTPGSAALGPPMCDGCGVPDCNDCFTEDPTPFCSDDDCCGTVCDTIPFCCDEDFGEWDALCVAVAHITCDPTGGADPCESFLSGGCTDPTPGLPGCSNTTCCNTVCDIDPFCCNVEWDEDCVLLAVNNCQSDPSDGTTPDFGPTADGPLVSGPSPSGPWQQYLTAGFPTDGGGNNLFLQQTGFSGEGMNIFDPNDEFGGVWGLGQQLVEEFGIGTENLARGKTIKVGVVEHTAFPEHEDLVNKVTPEQGVEILILPQIANLSGNHGTATLGQIVAEDNDFGVTGIAPDADGYFFPIVSEGGGRLAAAVISALSEFGPGDVLNFSIGPGNGTLVSNEAEWMLIRAATDLGITSTISAGNDCQNLDDAGQFDGQDSGAVIVGAAWAGGRPTSPFGACFPPDPPSGPATSRYCRLGFSNYCQDCEAGEGEVHCSGWGHNVATTGYGDLFATGDPNRRYTSTFNGTSAAAPMIAGLVACAQGLAKQFFGLPLPPETIRGFLSDEDANFRQCLAPPNDEPPGSEVDPPCGGDFNCDEDPNNIGPFPNALSVAGSVIQSEVFGQSELVKEVLVLKGEHIFGNVFSIKQADNSFFVVRTQFTEPGDGPNTPSGSSTDAPTGPISKANIGPANSVDYIAAGETVDMVIEAVPMIPPDKVQTVNVTAIYQPITTSFALLMSQMWDWEQRKWTFVDFAVQTGGGTGTAFTVSNAAPFVNQNDGRILTRQYLFTFGQTSGNPGGPSSDPTEPVEIRLDLFDLSVNQGFGVIGDSGSGPGGGGGAAP